MKPATDFDCFADSYECALREALTASGEDGQYFARGRVEWLARCLRRIGSVPLHLLDFGCGTGATTSLLRKMLGAESIIGVDPSIRALEVAQRNHGSERVRFFSVEEYQSVGAADLVYSNGVFHHIPREQRGVALQYIFRTLRPGGLLSFWENNPWNPGTRHVMARCVFDRDAVTLTPIEAKRLLSSAGYTVLRTDFLFIFPRSLRMLRPAEKLVYRMPLGAQYQVLGQKPMSK
jgi:trans-aconitate methyltransferase